MARLATRRPLLVLAVWGALVGALAVKGIGVEERLHRTTLSVSGSGQDANRLGADHFGEFASLTVLLEGPRADVDSQGRRLARRFDRMRDVTVLSPWSRGTAGETLRPRADRSLIVVRVNRPFEKISREAVPDLRETLERSVREPVKGHLTGAPDVADGIHQGSIDALRRAELIAAPALMLVLLFVFRSAVAAGVTLTLGLMTIGAATGTIDLLNLVVPLDAVSLSLASMLGLALGVDYSLLVVSRFREELGGGLGPPEATRRAAGTAGRTVLFAGIALLVAAAASVVLAPGSLLASASTGSAVAVVLSVLAAMTALPAVLTLLGGRIDRLAFGRGSGEGPWAGLALRALRRPVLAGGIVALGIAALAAPAMALDSGPPDPRTLPESSVQRSDYQAVREALGPGWMAPYDVVLATRSGTITESRRLRAIERWQERIARRSDVAAVFGPGEIAERARELDRVPATLARSRRELDRGIRGQRRLARGLRQVENGVSQLQSGLGRAADGARRLDAGGDQAAGGAARLRSGLREAREGADRLEAGLDSAGSGADELASGARSALSGSRRLTSGIAAASAGTRAGLPEVERLAGGLREARDGAERLREPAQLAERELAEALAALDRMSATSKLDPQYRSAYESAATAAAAVSGRDPRTGGMVRPGYDGLDRSLATLAGGLSQASAGVERLLGELGRLAGGLARLESGSRELSGGLGRLRRGVQRLSRGLDRLDDGSGSLRGGLARLEDGAGSLAAGSARLSAGAGTLAGGLSSGASRTERLAGGVERMRAGVVSARVRSQRLRDDFGGSERLGDMARSGHFLLAALDSSPRGLREAAGFAVNLDRRGSAARITVVPAGDSTRAGHPLRATLDREVQDLARQTGTLGGVGGAAPVFQDFDARTSERLPLLILVLVLVTYLVLVPVFRSVLLPLIAVLLNVATVIAAFGVMALAFQGDSPILGGPGFLDAIMVIGIFSIVFGLSIDYAVFLIARMREGHALSGSTDYAIEYGLRKTARIITGAAAIMSSVFIALALADIATLRQFGLGLTVAVLLDATVVRLLLLPSLIRLAGDASWWLPAWLDRLLPSPPEPRRPASPLPAAATNGSGGEPGVNGDVPTRASIRSGGVR